MQVFEWWLGKNITIMIGEQEGIYGYQECVCYEIKSWLHKPKFQTIFPIKLYKGFIRAKVKDSIFTFFLPNLALDQQ